MIKRILVAAALILPPVAAQAQTDIVVMRRAIAAPRPKTAAAGPVVRPGAQCKAITANMWATTSNVGSKKVATLDEAQDACEAFRTARGPGVCGLRTEIMTTYYFVGSDYIAWNRDNEHSAADCR